MLFYINNRIFVETLMTEPMENTMFARRNVSIDMLRGLTMLLMVFVNDLWSVREVPHFLEHFERFEDGMGVADIVFPMFLFAMGMSIPYAIERRFAKGYTGESTLGHILSRTLALVVMGAFIVNSEHDFCSVVGYGLDLYRLLFVAAFFLIWNQYKDGSKVKRGLRVCGVAVLAFLAFSYRTPDGGYFKAGWWGILGILGWTYCFCAVTYLLARKKPFRILFVWIALCVVNLLVTRMRGGAQLLPGQTFLTDLTGVLRLGNGCFAVMTTGGMLLSLAENRLFAKPDLCCFRTLKGEAIPERKGVMTITSAFLLAAVLAIAAAVLHNWWTVSKLVGTLPWCLYVSSISICLYVILRALEAHGRIGWFRPLNASGTATLTVYMMPYVLYSVNDYLGLYEYGSLSGLFGLLKCVAFSLLCVGLTALLVRLGIKLKI